MKKNVIIFTLLLCVLIFLNSCEDETNSLPQQDKTNEVDFENFSVGVENNTLIFDSEENLQACIDYLDSIGEKNYDNFEADLGYNSYRSTGKELPQFEDAIMKTLINPNMEIVICGYLIVSDFEDETATAYKLENYDICELASINKDELPSYQFDADDDFFAFLDGDDESLKSCCKKSTTKYLYSKYFCGNTTDDYKLSLWGRVDYERSLYYKKLYLKSYLEIGVFVGMAATLHYNNGSEESSVVLI